MVTCISSPIQNTQILPIPHIGPSEPSTHEVDLAKRFGLPHEGATPETPIVWEQWCGVIQRGHPNTLILFRLDPRLTAERAPGPGPIRLAEWTDFAQARLADRNVILHTDGARSYGWHVAGMLHDHVVHKKKLTTISGRRVWMVPFFTKWVTHELLAGGTIKVGGGTQIIDRFWRTLRAFLVGHSAPVGSHALARRVRSCQWNTWHRGQDKWVATGHMLQNGRAARQTASPVSPALTSSRTRPEQHALPKHFVRCQTSHTWDQYLIIGRK